MRERNAALTKWGQFLYRAGLASKRVMKNGEEERCRLHDACQNAERLLKLEEERRQLFEHLANETATACEWDAFWEVKKQLAPALKRFSEDAKRYEWPPLATLSVTEEELSKERSLEIRDVPTFEELMGGRKCDG